jgi:hypothetical protein
MDEMPPEAQDENDDAAAEDRGDGNGASRTRSLIGFPYSPLRDAEVVATVLSHQLPGYGSPEQVAGHMGQTPTSGTFRTKVATARTFGAVKVTRGRIEITEIGKRLVDPESRDTARVEAFLHVPLFQVLYENHKTGLLPGDQGLETEIIQAGVSRKQAGRARQAFQRSAEQAGFFKTAKDRLILPASGMTSPITPKIKDEQTIGSAPPNIEIATWNTLLDEGENWTAEDTKAYVDAARVQRNIRRRKRP